MDRLRGFFRQVRAILFGRTADRELDEEIQAHLEMETARNIALGIPPEDATRRARAVFGGRDAALEAHRDVRGGRWIEDALADARYAFRTLRQNAALTAAVVLTLALGIGANTAIFSTLHAVVLRPLPFADTDRLVMIWEKNPERGWNQADASPANFLDWREQVDAFDDVAAYPAFGGPTVLNHDGEAQLLSSMTVTGNFFSVLGVRPVAGRTFTDEETWEVGEGRALISHRLWKSRFGGDSSIIDRIIDLGGFPVRVVGVVPASFAFPGWEADVWRPTAFDRAEASATSFRRSHWLKVIGRLRPGVSLAQADASLQVVVHRLQQEYPATNTNMGAGLTPLHRFLVGDVQQYLLALQAAVALLLLIACANVGKLMLVRAADRERESVVRLALGAGRGRLVRQAFTESLVLASLGGVAGIAVGWGGTLALAAMQPEGMLPVQDVGMNPGVLLFALAIVVGSGLLFGIGPALWARHRMPADVLKEGGRGATRSRLRRWSNGLAVAELAIAVMLMAGAGLLVRSWWRVQAVDPGLTTEGLLTVSVVLPPGRFDTGEKRQQFHDDALERLRALPGVTTAGTVSRLSMTRAGWTSDFAVAGRGREEFGIDVVHREVSPEYHGVVQVPLHAGRSFTAADGPGSPPVVLINDVLARRYFPNEDPIGKRVAFDRYPDSTSYWRTIVGVVGSERQAGLEVEARPEFFAPVSQDENGPRQLVIRSTVDPMTLVPAVRTIVAAVNPGAAINRIRTMVEIRDAALARRRFVMTLVLTFAGAGLLLSVVGVYGVMAQLARGRRRELGIRIALGAPLAGIQMLLVRKGLGLAAFGAAIGIAGALAASSLVASMLYGVEPSDPLTLIAVSVVLAGAAVVATLLPARRAARVDPIETLRAE